MSQPTDEDKLNALVVEIRVLESTYNELTSRQSLLERALIENRAALDALKGLAENTSDEVLSQIGGGAMLRSKPPSTDKVLVSIGSNVVLEKTREEAVALMEGRAREVEKSLVSVIGQRNEIAERLDADRQVLNSVLSRQNQQE
ncbi:MAG: prefoldin subunit alpha [Thaumarchaeota archaeon]|nr:prefoldin subunit alpha [Nitrososphaerota archaeon]